ncbi:MAG: hypothetical protein HYZ26_04355 [Chloroflexi bacterium]|nr:hypothetical protein [Chloroflexota bacterium]
MLNVLKRLFFGVFFALLAGAFALAFNVYAAQAGDPPLAKAGECAACHTVLSEHWAESSHASATQDEIFQQAWQAQGQPSACFACHTTGYDANTGQWAEDGVACATCHHPRPEDHPNQDVMPTDVSADLCGQCHLDSFADFDTSAHDQVNLSCSTCHNAHTNELKADSSQQLCQTCHRPEAHYYDYTSHAVNGVTCIDCHLKVNEGTLGEGHAARRHIFSADIDTCNGCHSDGMHQPSSSSSVVTAPDVTSPLAAGLIPSHELANQSLERDPKPASATGFVLVAMLVGLMGGLILAPYAGNRGQRDENDR